MKNGEIMFKVVIALAAVLSGVNAINGNCRALILGGGSDRGAFQAGALVGLIENLPAGEATWDVISANGVGAIHGLIASQYEIGNEVEMVSYLTKFWNTFHKSKIYKSWFGGHLVGYYKKTGFFNDAPLTQTIESLPNANFQRLLSVGITDLVTGYYYSVNSTVPSNLMLKAIVASFNDYAIFPVTEYSTATRDFQFVSGDVVFPVDIQSAINSCFSLGYSQDQIIADIIMVTGENIDVANLQNYNTIEVVDRYFQVVAYHNIEEKIINAKNDYPGVNFRTEIQILGSQKISFLNPYDYLPGEISREFKKGVSAAVNALNLS